MTLPTLKSRETTDARLPTPAIVEKKMASRETSYWRIVRGGDCHKQSICGFTFFLNSDKRKTNDNEYDYVKEKFDSNCANVRFLEFSFLRIDFPFHEY